MAAGVTLRKDALSAFRAYLEDALAPAVEQAIDSPPGLGGIFGKLGSVGSTRSQACPRLVYTTNWGLKRPGSSRLPAGIVVIPGMPLEAPATGEPQVGQKLRRTVLPLSAFDS